MGIGKQIRQKYLDILTNRFGKSEKLGKGYTLFHFHTPDIVIYFRYASIKRDKRGIPVRSFYGLSSDDVEIIKDSNKQSFLILLTPEEDKNLFIPFNQFENLFEPSKAEKDRQYKVNYYYRKSGYIVDFSKIGRYSTEKFHNFENILKVSTSRLKIPRLSHGQIQSLIGYIGFKQGYELFFPKKDYNQLDYNIVNRSCVQENLPSFNNVIDRIIKEIDVIWLRNDKLIQFFEVEHSTPIYSGLLRFNDVAISINYSMEFNIIAEDERENKFSLEINRPTFTKNNLIEKTTFISYESIYRRYFNLTGKYYENKM